MKSSRMRSRMYAASGSTPPSPLAPAGAGIGASGRPVALTGPFHPPPVAAAVPTNGPASARSRRISSLILSARARSTTGLCRSAGADAAPDPDADSDSDSDSDPDPDPERDPDRDPDHHAMAPATATASTIPTPSRLPMRRSTLPRAEFLAVRTSSDTNLTGVHPTG